MWSTQQWEYVIFPDITQRRHIKTEASHTQALSKEKEEKNKQKKKPFGISGSRTTWIIDLLKAFYDGNVQIFTITGMMEQ